jgi:hypothetical protein
MPVWVLMQYGQPYQPQVVPRPVAASGLFTLQTIHAAYVLVEAGTVSGKVII